MAVRRELEQRFDAAVARLGGPRGLRLPPALGESMAAAAGLAGGRCPDRLSAYYTEEMPRELVAQLHAREGAASELLWRPLALERTPRLRTALGGLFATLARCELPAAAMLGAGSAEELLAQRPSVAELYQPTLFGSGLPMVGAYPAERQLLLRELDAGAEPLALIDLRLSGNLVHELCHGLQREVAAPPCWMVTEAAAITLGALAFPRHVFPDQPGEAVPGVSLFVLVGAALLRLFGERALLAVVAQPKPLAELFGPRARALEVAGWQEWLRRREPPFARDALAALSWVKLAALCVAGARPPAAIDDAAAQEALTAAPGLPDLLAAADATPWRQTAWWQGPPSAGDDAMVEPGLRALCQANLLAPTFQTWPDEPPQGRLLLDVEACTLQAAPRARAIFGEPARWIFPPPLARLLAERGAARIRIEGARRRELGGLAAALLELAHGGAALPAELEVRWASSP